MAGHFERIRADLIGAKNGRQLRTWRNKYVRAADAFVAAAGDKPVAEITAQDALLCRKALEEKRKAEGVSTQYGVGVPPVWWTFTG